MQLLVRNSFKRWYWGENDFHFKYLDTLKRFKDGVSNKTVQEQCVEIILQIIAIYT